MEELNQLDSKNALTGFELANENNIEPVEGYQQAVQGATVPKFEFTTPKLAKAIENNYVLGVAIKDDVETLSDFERFGGKLTNAIPRQAVTTKLGQTSANIMWYQNGVKGMSDFINDDQLAEGANQFVEYEKELADLSIYDRKDDLAIDVLPGLASGLYQIGEAVVDNPNLALGSLAAGLLRGPFGSVGTMLATTSAYQNFNVTAGNVYKQIFLDPPPELIKERGITKQDAMYYAVGTAAINSGIEFVSVGYLASGAKELALKTKIGQKISAAAIVNSVRKGINLGVLESVKKIGQGVVKVLPEFAKQVASYTGKAVVTQGVPEVLQGTTERTAVEMGKNEDKTLVESIMGNLFSKEAILEGTVGTLLKPAVDSQVIVAKNAYGYIQSKVAVDREKGDAIFLTEEEVVLRNDLETEKQRLEQDTSILKKIIDIEKNIKNKDNPAINQVKEQLDTNRTWFISKDALMKLESKNKGYLADFEKETGYSLLDENEMFSLTGETYRRLYEKDSEIAQMISHTPESRTLQDFETIKLELQERKAIADDVLNLLQKPNLSPEQSLEAKAKLQKITESSTEGVKDIETNIGRDIPISKETAALMSSTELELYDDLLMKSREESAKIILAEEKVNEQRAIQLDVREGMGSRGEKIESNIKTSITFNAEKLFDPGTEIDPKLIAVLKDAYPELKNKNTLEIQLSLLTKQKTKASSKYSIFAFDPDTLPSDLQESLENKRVKDKKAFVKGGISWKLADKIAEVAGIKGGAKGLFDSLLLDPTIAEYRQEEYEKQLGIQADISTLELQSTEDDFLKAFSNKAKVYAKEIEYMMREETGKVRKMISRLGTRWKNTEDIKKRAETIAKQIKLRDLKPEIFQRNQYNFGVKVHKAFASGDFFEMFQFKKLQMVNALVEGYAVRYRKIIDAKSARVKRLSTPESRDVLFAAGPEFVKAFDILQDAFDGKPMGTSKIQDIIELYKPYESSVSPEFANRAVSPRDVKVQQGDLTFEQANAILNLMIGIHGLAKNAVGVKVGEKLLSKLDMQRQVAINTRVNPLYDAREARSLTEKNYNIPFSRSSIDLLGSMTAAITSYYTTVHNRLDLGDMNGFFSDILVNGPMKALAKEANDNTIFQTYLEQKVSETIGKEEFEKYPTMMIRVPELASQITNGELPKSSLMSIAGHLMSESGSTKMSEFFKVEADLLQEIVEEHLSDTDFRFIEAMQTYFDTVTYPAIVARYERYGQVAPAKVINKPRTIRGKEYRGGYWPLKGSNEVLLKTNKGDRSWLQIVQSQEIGKMLKATDVATRSGTEQERTNISGPYDLSWDGFLYKVREQIHHNALSETMINISNLLSDDQIVTDIINVMGKEQFANMVGILEHFALGSHDYDVATQLALEPMNKWFDLYTKSLQASSMGFGVMTGLRQLYGVGAVTEAINSQLREPLSKEALKNYIAPLLQMSVNQKKMANMAQAIAIVDPQFKNYVETLKRKRFFKKLFNYQMALDMSKTGEQDLFGLQGAVFTKYRDFLDFSLAHISFIQLNLNVAAYSLAYQLAMEGKIKNINAGDKEASRIFAGTQVRISLSDDSALGQSQIQKQFLTRLFLFGQGQLQILTNRIIGAHQRMGLARNADGFDLRNKAFAGALISIATASTIPAIIGAIAEDLWRGLVPKSEEQEEIKEKREDQGKEEPTLAKKIGVTTVSSMFNNYPLLRDFGRAIEQSLLQDKDFLDYEFQNIYFQNFINFLQGIVGFAMVAIQNFGLDEDDSNRQKISEQELRNFSRAALNMSGFPGGNVPFNPFTDNMNVRNAILEKWIRGLGLVQDYKFKREGKPRDEDEGSSFNFFNEAVDPQNDTASITVPQFKQELFDNVVTQLQNPDLTQFQKQELTAIRDVTYSVNGFTNPEGAVITTDKGQVDLTDYIFRENLTIMIRGISALETNNFKEFTSSTNAKGFYQMTTGKTGTWHRLRDKYPQFDLPDDPNQASYAQQTQIYWKLVGENLLDLKRLNQEPTLDNLFLIHMLGEGDFTKFVKAGPDDDLETLLPVAYTNNKDIMGPGTVEGIRDNVIKKLSTYIRQAEQELSKRNLLTPE